MDNFVCIYLFLQSKCKIIETQLLFSLQTNTFDLSHKTKQKNSLISIQIRKIKKLIGGKICLKLTLRDIKTNPTWFQARHDYLIWKDCSSTTYFTLSWLAFRCFCGFYSSMELDQVHVMWTSIWQKILIDFAGRRVGFITKTQLNPLALMSWICHISSHSQYSVSFWIRAPFKLDIMLL